ncbi:hypothetical protein Clacol_004906 [Clathrus columnatus]|uniref:Uncharacterized protein n=1 Tax=Clathrus columnatus TaxID=1419009 RepID=A0AAV5A7T2_9AGAM|nr:hypothetical protein Clacol_004906 [Clathrus columnatus]
MGGNQAALFEGRNSHDPDSQHVDYYFVKKLTLALEQLSLAREGRVEYDNHHSNNSDSGSESSTPPSSAPVSVSVPSRVVPVRRFNIPLLSLTDTKDPRGAK